MSRWIAAPAPPARGVWSSDPRAPLPSSSPTWGVSTWTYRSVLRAVRPARDACPTDTITYDGDKVSVDHRFCIHCGACEHVGPVEGAIRIVRTSIQHMPIESGAGRRPSTNSCPTTRCRASTTARVRRAGARRSSRGCCGRWLTRPLAAVSSGWQVPVSLAPGPVLHPWLVAG